MYRIGTNSLQLETNPSIPQYQISQTSATSEYTRLNCKGGSASTFHRIKTEVTSFLSDLSNGDHSGPSSTYSILKKQKFVSYYDRAPEQDSTHLVLLMILQRGQA